MGRLTTLAPQVQRLPSKVSSAPPVAPGQPVPRVRNEHWRKWYHSTRWRALRWDVLVRDLFTCQLCRRLEHDTAKLVCDHVEPHRGDPVKFWSGPFQTLCKPCHDGEKQKDEARFDRAPWL